MAKDRDTPIEQSMQLKYPDRTFTDAFDTL